MTVALSDAALESLERSWAKDTRSQWLEQQADSDEDHNFRPEHIPSTRKVARTEWPKKIQDIWARWDEQAAELKQQRKAEGLPPIEPGMAKMPNLRALSRVWGDWKRAHPDADPQEKIHTHMEILATRSHFSHQAWIKRQPYYGPFVVDYDSRVEDDPGASRERDNRGRGRTFVAHQGDGNVAASDRRPALLGIKTWPLTPEFDPKTHARVHNRGLKERLRKMNLDTRSLGEMWREGQARREAGAEAKAAKLAADEARREAEIEARAARIAADEARKAERAAMLEEQADDDDGERKLMDPEDDVPRQL